MPQSIPYINHIRDVNVLVPKVSRLAIVGAGLLPFGILATLLFLLPASFAIYSTVDSVTANSGSQVAWWQWLLRLTILPLGIISPFATTILGWISLSQIRASNGKLIGKPIALLDALFYPILLLDGVLIALLFLFIARIPEGNLAFTEMITLLTYILVLVVDFVIVAIAWAKVRSS